MMATSCIIKPLCNGFNFFWLQCSEYNGNTMINVKNLGRPRIIEGSLFLKQCPEELVEIL